MWILGLKGLKVLVSGYRDSLKVSLSTTTQTIRAGAKGVRFREC